ncbi:hypothetical protein [Desmospora profundinema]|uniref:Uncharacterized protein n=1 Tax=Desmospora profundinema TaxID=1571184 RepID=A0ABU1IMT0_9BACL|nr:hypothetical protein [Desmospora profundinema]MDR6225708.1 hypothetical protein [Desmospora profundinema]
MNSDKHHQPEGLKKWEKEIRTHSSSSNHHHSFKLVWRKEKPMNHANA